MGEGIRHSGRGPHLRLGRSATSFHAVPLWRAHGLRLAARAQAAQAAVDLMEGQPRVWAPAPHSGWLLRRTHGAAPGCCGYQRRMEAGAIGSLFFC